MDLGPTISQRTYPGVGDIDECGMLATLQAILAANPGVQPDRPTVKAFRAVAGDPDDGVRDGWSLTELTDATVALWPGVIHLVCRAMNIDTFLNMLVNDGGTASVAVASLHLPATHRYGFTGPHQISLSREPGTWYIVNPLAKDNAPPQAITEKAIRTAINKYSEDGVFALYFPPKKGDGMSSFRVLRDATVGKLVVDKPGTYYMLLDDRSLHGPLPVGWSKDVAFGPVRLAVPIPSKTPTTADRATGYIVGEDAAFLLDTDVKVDTQTYFDGLADADKASHAAIVALTKR